MVAVEQMGTMPAFVESVAGLPPRRDSVSLADPAILHRGGRRALGMPAERSHRTFVGASFSVDPVQRAAA